MVPVVVGAKGDGGIARCNELAIVPYEGGEIVIRRERGSRAVAVSHYFGGSTVRQEIAIAGSALTVSATMTNEGMPLEWMAVTIV
jgi:hypothetical protein